MSNQQNDILRETIMETLADDYWEYLSDLTLEELQKIADSGYLTLSQIREVSNG
jgi:hypothetical protein